MNRWLIEWYDLAKPAEIASSRIAHTAEEAVAIIRELLHVIKEEAKSEFNELFAGGRPEAILRHLRHTAEFESSRGRLVIKKL